VFSVFIKHARKSNIEQYDTNGDSCMQEILAPVVERSVTIACYTAVELVVKVGGDLVCVCVCVCVCACVCVRVCV